MERREGALAVSGASEALLAGGRRDELRRVRPRALARDPTRGATAGSVSTPWRPARYDSVARRARCATTRALFGRVALDLRSQLAAGSASPPTRGCASTPRRRARSRRSRRCYFQFGRYLMIAGSRPGGPPLNLQGIWNPHMRPPWSSNYTININTEMNYWPAETTNLAECHEPLLRFVSGPGDDGRRHGAALLRLRGWCAAPQQRHLGPDQPGRRRSGRAARSGRTGRWADSG